MYENEAFFNITRKIKNTKIKSHEWDTKSSEEPHINNL